MEWIFPLPNKKQIPLVLRYNPELRIQGQDFFNVVLGYPRCPMAGRYNKGEYRLPETAAHISFDCIYTNKGYQCGATVIDLPSAIVKILQEIPQIIPHNKGASQEKNTKILDFHPIHFPVLKTLSFKWVVSFGQLGKDFLNYINHTYIFGEEIMAQEKLKRNIHMLPISVHFPLQSGLQTEEVERGLSVNRLRSQYMSIHLKLGSPAFSPNNMRLGIEGMAKISSQRQPNQQHKKGNNKQKKKYVQKQLKKQSVKQQLNDMPTNTDKEQNPKEYKAQNKQLQQSTCERGSCQENPKSEKQQTSHKGVEQAFVLDCSELQKHNEEHAKQSDNLDRKEEEINDKKPLIKEQEKKPHQGFVHFYTIVLLQGDYRVYYHWHIQDQFRQQCLKQLFNRSKSIEELLQEYSSFTGGDSMSFQLRRIFKWI